MWIKQICSSGMSKSSSDPFAQFINEHIVIWFHHIENNVESSLNFAFSVL